MRTARLCPALPGSRYPMRRFDAMVRLWGGYEYHRPPRAYFQSRWRCCANASAHGAFGRPPVWRKPLGIIADPHAQCPAISKRRAASTKILQAAFRWSPKTLPYPAKPSAWTRPMKGSRRRCGCSPLRFGVNALHTAAGSEEPAGRSSRTQAHRRPVAVLPLPGASIGTGVSSACSVEPAITWRYDASIRGRNRR